MRIIALIATIVTVAAGVAPADPPTIYEHPGEPPIANAIDRVVFDKLKAEGITPARLCSDAVFLRRVHLDVIGTLPTEREARAFLASRKPDKRARLIDHLLAREEFNDYQALRFCDLLRVKSEFPINLWPNAVQAYHRWVRDALANNLPYDRFARALLTSSGSNFRVPPVNFYRAVQTRDAPNLAATVALTFMGDRMGDWPVDRVEGLAVFFARVGYKRTAEWKEEIVYFDRASDATPEAVLPDGSRVKLDSDADPREILADWLITADNPWFARAAANRAWFWLLGRGIVHEPDNFRKSNPPSHPQLLDLLARKLVSENWDLRKLYRFILNSSTYQLAPVPRSKHPKAAELFASYPIGRLDAEVLIDALCQITGTTEEYHSKIPEPFTWIPRDLRSIALPDGSITSSFLEMFGRPSRDTGMANERNNRTTAAQRLHLLNSSHVRDKLEKGPAMRGLSRGVWKNPKRTIESLYLRVLSRPPTAEELKVIKQFTDANSRGRDRGRLLATIAWALVNSPEFLCRH